MSLSEFDIIDRYFNLPALTLDAGNCETLPLGIGDDCALIQVPEGQLLAVTLDMLVADVHFPAAAPAGLIASKAMAVNLSDLAAMGARAVAVTLGLCLPEVNEDWLARFSEGLAGSVQKYRCPLIGGDITKGPLAITIQAHGLVDAGKALTRGGARPGDKIYVSGYLGAAGLALELLDGSLAPSPADAEELRRAYYQPEPRLQLGALAVGLASSAIDISDGLLADLGHLAHRSGVGLCVTIPDVPVAPAVNRILGARGRADDAIAFALSAGDDYELALTVPPGNAGRLVQLASEAEIPLTCIGRVVEGAGLICEDEAGRPVSIGRTGYQHFSH